jgi:sodium-dependent dicarboxylate transporter 2/3/5
MPENQSAMILMTATVAASYAFMLPIATPPNAIVMSSRVISIKEMAMIGFKLNLIGVTVLTLVAYFIWGLFI